MKALIDRDIIISFSGDTEIGQIPAGVGIERLRFDGTQIVDLAELSQFWVEETAGRFVLHCIEVPNSQLVIMQYSDRKYLLNNSGNIRLKTQQEIDAEKYAALIDGAKTRLSNKVGKYIDLELSQLAFICALIVYARQQPAALGAFFDSLIPDIKDIFPMSRWELILQDFAKDLKQFVTEYYNEID